MKTIILLTSIAMMLVAQGAVAQQAPDARLDTYRKLLTEANDRVADLAAQLQQAREEAARAKAAPATTSGSDPQPKGGN